MPVTTHCEYQKGVQQLLSMMDSEPAEGTAAADKLVALAIELADYENKQGLLPNQDITPEDVRRFLEEQNRFPYDAEDSHLQ